MKKAEQAEKIETLLNEIAVILQTKRSNVAGRVIGLRIGDTCGRCGGCGRYSYNQMHGDMCYGCHGWGTVMPKVLKKVEALKERAQEAASNGKLVEYLDGLRAKARSKNASKRIMAAWEAVIGKKGVIDYDWRKAADAQGVPALERTPEQVLILKKSAINDRCYRAQERFTKFETEFTYGRGGATTVKIPARDWTQFEAELNTALEEIAQAKLEAERLINPDIDENGCDHIDRAERYYNVQ